MHDAIEPCIEQMEKDLNCEIPYFDFDSEIVRFGEKKRCWVTATSWEFKGKEYCRVIYGDWSTDEKFEWKSWNESATSRAFNGKLKQAIEKQKNKLNDEKLKKHQECRDKWRPLFAKANQDPLHPYLSKKGIQDNYQARIMGNNLLVPLFDFENDFNGVQVITEHSKKFSTGIKIKGSFCPVKGVEDKSIIYFCEGYATGCSIYEATKGFVICCFTANNLLPVIQTFMEKFPESQIVLCADNDQWKDKNTGKEKAFEIKNKYPEIKIVLPVFSKTESKPTDFNDLHVLEGLDVVKSQIGKQEDKAENETNKEYYKRQKENGFSTVTQNGAVVRWPLTLKGYLSYLHKYIVSKETEEVYIYEDGYYTKVTDQQLKSFAQKHYNPPMDKEYQAREFVNTVKRFYIAPIADLIKKAASDPTICFKNGVYNYKTKEIEPHSYKNYHFVQINADITDDFYCPTWDQLMKNLTCDRLHLQQCIEEYIGYALSGMPYKFNKVMIFKGGGANGKTTLINAIRSIIGEENSSAASISDLAVNKFMAADLEHSLINFSEEEPPKKVFAETSNLKKLTGDSPIRVEQKGLKGYNIINRSKLIMSYNEIPYLSDFSEGMRRRLLIVPFDADLIRHPELKIPNLHENLIKERSAIINRCLAGLDRLLVNNDFTYIPENKTEINQIIKASDTVIEWWSEYVKITQNENDRLTNGEMYDHYLSEMGNSSRISKIGFGRKIKGIIEEINKNPDSKVTYGAMKLPGAIKTLRGAKGIALH